MTAVLLLVCGATLVSVLARRVGRSAPLVLVTAGLAASFLPGLPDYHLDPDLALLVFTPPLVYADARESSYLDLRANARPIGLLSVGLVLASTLAVGLVARAVVPGLPWTAAFVLGAILAPTDAGAEVAVARRLRLPRRIVTILVAESIVNDATGMTVFRFTVALAAGRATSLLQGVGEFLYQAGGGVLVGLLLARPAGLLLRRLDDAVAENAVSLVVPFAAFALAESLRASGVLAVLVAGLHLGHRATGSSHRARLQEAATWTLVTGVLEAVGFALIGLQLRPVLRELHAGSDPVLLWYAGAVLAALLLVRIAWVFPATYLPRLFSARVRARDPAPPWQYPAAISWAGTRGVVSLAAAFAVPLDLPRWDLVRFLAFTAVLGTLLLQAPSFPVLVRRLGLREHREEHQEALAEAVAQETAADAAWSRLQELIGSGREDPPEPVLERLRDLAEHRRFSAWERVAADGQPEPPTAAYRRLRREMLATERGVFVRLRRQGRINDEVLRRVMHELDHEEAALARE
ncbi:Na+/H+ antiporter [Kitasatospora sp. LaBMicrA B282]|uniref:Na+/H+ antiporter n=1 Tax=Kitasatospora sp. LaBMicrA B282 TaxID=3420949 RepID=UPI003D12CE99